MALSVELRGGSGGTLGVTGELDDSIPALLPDLDPEEYPLLSGVDRYRSTMFNTTQMRRITIEAAKLEASATAQQKQFLDGILELCRRGSETVDAQLWFLGD